MKKLALTVFLVTGSAALIFSCGGNTKSDQPADPYAKCPKPAWVDNPNMEGGLTAVGIGRSHGGKGRARDKAVNAGRTELARILRTKVQAMTDRFFQETEDDMQPDHSTAIDFTRDVSRQLTDATLRGSRVIQYWTDCTTGEEYALVGLDTAAVVAEAKKAARAAAEAKALFIENKANEALEKMDSAIDKAFGTGGGSQQQ
ncbi:MAG: hypothetical protein GXP49_10080 [Deltaproteobacteria bacterium]|nr:hypothetical protein [Deltaproteobacteria bacterium]